MRKRLSHCSNASVFVVFGTAIGHEVTYLEGTDLRLTYNALSVMLM